MSKPAVKISPREQWAREIRKQDMDGMIRGIEKDLQSEKGPDKKKNIAACLAEAKKNGTYISQSQTLFGIGQKAYIVQNAEFTKKWATLDDQSKKIIYSRRGTAEQMMAGTPGPNTAKPGPTKPTGPSREQMLSVATYTNMEPKLNYSGPTTMHQIYARVRIHESDRRPGLNDQDLQKVEAGVRFMVAFDTGSEIQTVERSVWDAISGNGKFYKGVLSEGNIRGATGDIVPRMYVEVEISYFRDAECKLQIGSWQKIDAVYSDRPYEHNLSGREIYKQFDFFLPQGNGALMMGTNKAAMVWEYLMRSNEIKEVALINQWAAAAVAQAGASGAQGRAA